MSSVISPESQTVVIHATNCHEQMARMLGEQRRLGHPNTKQTSRPKTPEERLAADYWGALAEILVVETVERRGWRPGYTLLTDRPSERPDLRFGRFTIEVKGCPPEQRYFGCNAEQHEKNCSRPDFFYLPCLFTGPRTLQVCMPLPPSVIAGWRLMDNAESPYRSTHRDNLEPLPTWDVLKEVLLQSAREKVAS
jgi:hypothetical protein